jgi:hypothetical protein
VSRTARRHRTYRELKALKGERMKESRIEVVFKIGSDSLRVKGDRRKLRELI